jgi:glycosyltransferase involved in cell wall biosynthesis
VHRLDPRRVDVIPHGATPNLGDPPVAGSPLPVVLTWGLLGPGKGIETGIAAVAGLHRAGVDVRYVVAGETHPHVRAREGERYRRGLIALARRHGVDELVEFDARYRDWESLRALVRSSTLVLLPSESRDQVTSGVLVEALAAGKPVVATAFPHAVEVAPTGAVLVVAHGSVAACAAAIRSVVTQPRRRAAMEAAARQEGGRYHWDVVAARYDELIERVEPGPSVRPRRAG